MVKVRFPCTSDRGGRGRGLERDGGAGRCHQHRNAGARKVPAPAFEWASKVEAIASPVATLPSSRSGGRSRSATVHLRHIDIPVVPVLMNLGVNEMQTVANLKGKSTLLQTEINRDAVRALRQYVAAWSKATAASDEEMMQKGRRQLRDGGSAAAAAAEKEKEKEYALGQELDRLEALVEAEARDKGKNVEVLMAECFVARALAARTTAARRQGPEHVPHLECAGWRPARGSSREQWCRRWQEGGQPQWDREWEW